MTEINETTKISDLTDAQLFELNQQMLDSSTDINRPLIDEIAPIAALRAEYENGSPSFVQQIDHLQGKGYQSIRRSRGDGDCFYRSVAFSYVERIFEAKDRQLAVANSLSTLNSTLPMLKDAGFQEMVYEDFYDVLYSLVQNIVTPDNKGYTLQKDMLLLAFQSPEVSNSIVVYLRLLTSACIRANAEEFEPVLFHPELGEQLTVQQFCEAFVEAVGKEADHVQITALSRALQINIDVLYLDGHGQQVNTVEIRSNEDTRPLVLLYRPGHYDILVTK